MSKAETKRGDLAKPTTAEIRNRYQNEFNRLQKTIDELELTNRWYVWSRPLLFFPAIILILAGSTRPDGTWLSIILGWILALLFLGLLVFHERLRLQKESYVSKQRLFQTLLARLDRRWSDLTHVKLQANDLQQVNNATSDDLDVFGERSLFQWLCLASTRVGKRKLSRWLMEWSDAATLRDRQEAVEQLSQQVEAREHILWTASLISDSHANPEAFTDWATGPSWLASHRFSHVASWIGPALVFLGIAGLLVSRMQEISWLGWSGLAVAAVGLTINLALMVGMLGGIHDIFSRISSGHGEVQQYRAIFETVRNIEGKSELVRAIKMTCCESPMNALIGFAELSLLVQMANLQRNPLFYVPYLLLQLTIQWDVRVLERLDRWQQKYRDHASNWLDALASLEALLSASAVRYENSGWAVPIWTEKGQATAHFESLSHPLLEDSQRVGNDVTIDISRPLLLVTGSNMAGKSTLLRSMGLNLLLARVGAPMCASSYLGPPLELSTSICVRDSLQDGVSFFMAELHRLRDVVDTAKRNTGPNGRPLLVLLDEILQGTNSRERQIAVMHVAQQLVELGALIAMSTHDLELADLPKIGEAGQVVHFREYFETVSGVECMRFDYKMRAGPTPTTNALKLLEFVGLRNAKNPI